MKVYLNGNLVPASSPEAAALQPGHPALPGIYTTLRVDDGVAADLSAHRERLAWQAAELGVPPLPENADLAGIIRDLGTANGLDSGPARLRITLARQRPEGDLALVLEAMPPDLESQQTDGVAVITLGPAFARTHLPHLKTLDTRASRAALAEARTHGASEAIVHDDEGRLLEGAISNLFIRSGARWLTPPEDGRILAGLTRRRILKNMPGSAEAVLKTEDLAQAEEVFVCNSLRGILPVVLVDGRPVGDGRPGPHTLAARRALQA